MEVVVDRLEAMFLKSKADLEYIEKRLKLDLINNAAENGCLTEMENPTVILGNLRAIKEKHAALFCQLGEVTSAQKHCMDSLRINMSSVMELIQHLQQITSLEVSPATASGPQQPISCEYEKLSETVLKSVPFNMRSNTTLAELNVFYQQLQKHLGKDNSNSLSVQKMKQLKMNVSNAKLKVLEHLALIEIDNKGNIRLSS